MLFHHPRRLLEKSSFELIIFPTLSPTTTVVEGQVNGMAFPISAAELRYQAIVDSADNHSTPFSEEELDGNGAPAWSFDSNSTLDCLDSVLPSEEAILEVMMGID